MLSRVPLRRVVRRTPPHALLYPRGWLVVDLVSYDVRLAPVYGPVEGPAIPRSWDAAVRWLPRLVERRFVTLGDINGERRARGHPGRTGRGRLPRGRGTADRVLRRPMPSLQFLVERLTVLGLFAVFVTLGAVGRRDPQSHKRYIILASIALIEAGVGRWRFEYLTRPSPVSGWGWIELSVDLFLAPLIVWDLGSRGRLHPAAL